jgi:hypothetical protein
MRALAVPVRSPDEPQMQGTHSVRGAETMGEISCQTPNTTAAPIAPNAFLVLFSKQIFPPVSFYSGLAYDVTRVWPSSIRALRMQRSLVGDEHGISFPFSSFLFTRDIDSMCSSFSLFSFHFPSFHVVFIFPFIF